MISVLDFVFPFSCGIVALVTILPLFPSPHWAIRMWDFPRLQIVCTAAVLSIFAWISGQHIWLLVLGLCIAYQCWWIYPYTPFGRTEVKIPDRELSTDLTLLAANVEMTNPDRRALSALINDIQPDVIFLMETDQAWVDEISTTLSDYTVTAEPKDNYYGLMFATKLTARSVEVVYITDDDTPSLLAELETEDGRIFRFLGLHPRPPVPGEDTVARDDQLTYAARFGHVEDTDLIVMGDFNDVVWSRKSQYFKRVGGFLDPRLGRGFISSFHAKYPFLRFPIDHFFVTAGVVVSAFFRGPHIGSDHFPMIARVRFDKDLAADLNIAEPKSTEDEDLKFAAMVDRHRKKLDAKTGP